MEEYNVELESIAPEDFDLENFESQVQRELHWMLDSPPVQFVTTIKSEDTPWNTFRYRIVFYIKSFSPSSAVSIFVSVIIGFLLARRTSINLAKITIYSICCLGFLFLLKSFLNYREEQARKARQAAWAKQEAAKRRISQLMAGEILDKPSIRKLLCPSLKGVATDVFEISKVVTPVLTGAVIAGTIAIPLNSLLFAAIAVVIARSGINSLCADFK